MKLRPAVLCFAVLLLCLPVFSQNIPTATPPKEDDPANSRQPGTANPNNPPAPPNAPANGPTANAITVQGCLNGGKQGYSLVQQGTGAGFELESKSYQLKRARGKLVQITGREMSPNGKSDNLPRLDVEGLQVIADHCELPGKAGGASTSVPQRTNNPANTTQPDAATPRYEPSGAPDQTPPSQGNNPTNWGRTSGAPSPGTGNPPPPSTPPPKK